MSSPADKLELTEMHSAPESSFRPPGRCDTHVHDHQSRSRPRWLLKLQANFWRTLMQTGMLLHKLAAPKPPKPSFTRTVPTSISPWFGEIELMFYVPESYHQQRRQLAIASEDRTPSDCFPLIVNFHGGGFTLGRATDDARWIGVAVQQLTAVVVSVNYRRAPEHFFPTAVEDGADAIMYLVAHADELCLDVERIAVSGFSSGGNMCFTVPLRLQEELDHEAAAGEDRRNSVIAGTRPPLQKCMSEGRMLIRAKRKIHVRAIVAFYPPTDYTVPRKHKRAKASRPDLLLPAMFTNLFDESYLSPPTLDLTDPYLSPGLAPEHMLAGLPEEVVLFTCEHDMLVEEAEAFKDRLEGLGKTVHYREIQGVPHAWDKAPNPFRAPQSAYECYGTACEELRKIFGGEG